jgi:hypothetical protein
MVLTENVQYTYYETVGGDKAVFHGASHSDTHRDTVECIRTAPKRSGLSNGTRRTYVRFTTDDECTYADSSTADKPTTSGFFVNLPVDVANPNTVVKRELEKILGFLIQNITAGDTAVAAQQTNGTAVIALAESGTLV